MAIAIAIWTNCNVIHNDQTAMQGYELLYFLMKSRKMLVVLCVINCFCMAMCNVSLQFVNVDFLRGNILHGTSKSSVLGCAAACGQHSPSCRGSRYNVASEECQLLGNGTSVLTPTFDAVAGWTVFMTVWLSIDLFLTFISITI